MTDQEKVLFNKLASKRKQFAELSQDLDYKGMWEVLIKGIYSEYAHFIYELLQNAEDVKATSVRFILTEDSLYFIHNGKIPFTITDVDNPNENGHINAITALGRTGKKISETIGKFGIGFKAVFQYTKTPHIIDPKFQFKIHDYIVPELLDDFNIDIQYDKSKETIFYFPFMGVNEQTDNNKVKSRDEAYKDIMAKLKDLDKPTLFLSNLKDITWQIGNEKSTYKKEILKSETYDNVTCEKIKLSPDNTIFLIFTRKHNEEVENINLEYSYSVGFGMENGKLKPIESTRAYCFFSTQQPTNLNFLFHAPFLLNSNRESIPENQDLKIKDDKGSEYIIKENFNEILIKQLAELSADALLVLRDLGFINDNIINIIPYKEFDFCSKSNNYPYTITKYQFFPFFEKIKEKLKTENLLPAQNEEFSTKEHAYWAAAPNLTELFSKEQLAMLFDDNDAKWVFTSFGYQNTQNVDKEKAAYISDLTCNRPFPKDILGKINSKFTQKQSFEWLHKLYAYLTENGSYKDDVKTKPIFKDSNENACWAFENKAKQYMPTLFLPTDTESKSFKTIHEELLKNEKSKEFILAFGIKEPDLKDEIYNHILPLYVNDGEIDTESHFQKFFKYYKDNHGDKTEIEKFVELIKDKEFISYKSKTDETTYRGRASEIYYPTDDLREYFEAKPDTRFVDLDDYKKQIDISDKELLKEFLLKLGVEELPRTIEEIIKNNQSKIKELSLSFKQRRVYEDWSTITDKYIDGCIEAIKSITSEKSIIIWKLVSAISVNEWTKGRHVYAKNTYVDYTETFDTTILRLLQSKEWLVKQDGSFVSPKEITIKELRYGYDITSYQAKELIELLQFKSLETLTEEQQIQRLIKEKGITIEDIQKLAREKDRKSQQIQPSEQIKITNIEEGIDWLDKVKKEIQAKPQNSENESTEIANNHEENSKSQQIEIDFDEDEELAKGIDILKEQLKVKKCRQELADTINSSQKYSYVWFEAYLKLLLTYGETQSTTQQKSLSFQEIKLQKIDSKISNKYFLLCGSSSYIPQTIEDAEDFKVTLKIRNHKDESFIVEGVSKKGQNLLIYCREALSPTIITHLQYVTRVEINFTPVIDLLSRLNYAFTRYLTPWEDIENTLPALKYIYGPPGTGKTTTICNRINSILQENPDAKFLILTPTNKAADVLVKKLWDINPNIFSTRVGKATDPELEEEGLYRDSLTIDDLHSISVVASTIHRLPYFEIHGEKDGETFSYQLFKHRNFDYVIFDESSMTNLPYIVFAILALFQSNPETKFIVAGDPKQIPPVVEVNDAELENFDFQDENIYKMLGLESFNPEEQNIREIDSIENLGRQYRSVKQIGQLFSELSYSKLLQHDRETNRTTTKTLPTEFQKLVSAMVTFIDIPLGTYNSIYKINKLLYSSYQSYVSILIAEIVKYFDKLNKDQQWTIGLIAPYKAQAVLLNKLITSYGISDNISVYADTVHGFQGDECDIILFVCNPNSYSFTNHPKCLLSKEYIYNVAISRAKDYLIVLHPYFAIKDNKFINLITQSYRTNFGVSVIKQASEIEKQIFGKEKYIESNSYTTGHDNVNVFGLSEMKYFIKVGDSAIDIQLRSEKGSENFTGINEKEVVEVFKTDTEIEKPQTPKVLGQIDLSQFDKYKKK